MLGEKLERVVGHKSTGRLHDFEKNARGSNTKVRMHTVQFRSQCVCLARHPCKDLFMNSGKQPTSAIVQTGSGMEKRCIFAIVALDELGTCGSLMADAADVNRLHAEKAPSATEIELTLMVARKKKDGHTMPRAELQQLCRNILTK